MWYSASDVMTIKANLISVLLQFARTAFITFHEDVHNKTLSIPDPALGQRAKQSHGVNVSTAKKDTAYQL